MDPVSVVSGINMRKVMSRDILLFLKQQYW